MDFEKKSPKHWLSWAILTGYSCGQVTIIVAPQVPWWVTQSLRAECPLVEPSLVTVQVALAVFGKSINPVPKIKLREKNPIIFFIKFLF